MPGVKEKKTRKKGITHKRVANKGAATTISHMKHLTGPWNTQKIDAALSMWELRKQGLSYTEIANVFGVSVPTVRRHVEAIYTDRQELLKEAAPEVRDMEVARLDQMYKNLAPGITAGDPQAIAAGLKIMDRRAKFLGLDQPTGVHLTGEVPVFVMPEGYTGPPLGGGGPSDGE